MLHHLAQWELDLATISKQPSNNKVDKQYMETNLVQMYDSWPSVHNQSSRPQVAHHVNSLPVTVSVTPVQ